MTRKKLMIRTGGGEYPIVLGAGVRAELVPILRALDGVSGVCLVTDANVDRHHGRGLEEVLRGSDLPLSKIVVPAGEASKSVAELYRLWRELVKAGCDRDSLVVAFGGGVVGDLAGFAAATVLRGIDFVQVPTTLLAMVDASVGGKTGIDLEEGKNLVGAFHQPRAVVIDLDFLETLPRREVASGWGEVIKAAAIRDEPLFSRLERDREALLRREAGVLTEVVEASVRVKAGVVEADELETGLRMILNFGHTLAHALETATGYGRWVHGEAVALGMVFAAGLAEAIGVAVPGTAQRLRGCLAAYGLPVDPGSAAGSPLDVKDLVRILERDKKKGPEGIRWVLPARIGQTEMVAGISRETVERELRSFLGG